MPFGSVTLSPGVNVERTPTTLRAGFSQSSLIRFKDSLVQKYGGWDLFVSFTVAGVPRELHAWQDLHGTKQLAIGTTTQLNVISNGGKKDISPQVFLSNFAPAFSTTINSPIVDVTDPNVSNVTVNDAIFFNVPVSQGGIILDGLYQITEITGTHSYQITASNNATATETNPTATNATTALGNNTLHFAATPAWVVAGMVVSNLTTPASIPSSTIVLSTTGTTVVLSANAAAGVGSGDNIVFSSVPVFTTTSGSSSVTVTFIGHGLLAGNGPENTVNFVIPTTGNGITIFNDYKVNSVADANNFSISSDTASASSSFAMNAGLAQLEYFIALGPPPAGAGFGLGGFGLGGFGLGASGSGNQTGDDLAASDWTLDNWGDLLLACPQNGGIYYWGSTTGFQNASLISTAPPFNTGIFISMAQQILIAFGSSIHLGLGWQQQPLLVQWCNSGNFFEWTASAATQAGNFTIPNGSKIIGGMAVSNQNLIWTDADLWAMAYISVPDVYGFNKIGAGAGLVSMHAAQQLRGSVYWMGKTNFYVYNSSGVNVLPCSVWDAVFQNLNTSFLQNVRAMPNTPFNEVGWFYPSAASVSGECDSYVKMNITDPGAPWDYGPLPRSTWIDQNIFGMPIATTSNGIIYQHETTNDAAGGALLASFTTGEFYLAEGEDFVFVDQVLPDFKWSMFPGGSSAQIQITFNVTNYPGDTPIQYGPYTVTQATEFISTRFRGRLMSITIQSSDLNSWWRIGSIKYRYSVMGRR